MNNNWHNCEYKMTPVLAGGGFDIASYPQVTGLTGTVIVFDANMPMYELYE